MALRQEYALAHSRFNDFLFAFVAEEKSGQNLTVLSAMSRLGLNPWGEASRLSKLSQDAASADLTAIFARLPKDDWQQDDMQSISGRLVTYLPAPNMKDDAPTEDGGPIGRLMPATDNRKLIFWIIFAAAIAVAIINQFKG